MPSLNDPVSKLHLVKPEHEKALNNLGIKNLRDLIYYFPRDWQDLSEIKTIAEIRPGELINIRARVKQVANPGFPFRRVKITEALLEDKSGNAVAVWFNQPYIKNSLRVGAEYYFSGKAQIYSAKKQQTLQLAHPAFELVKENTIHVAGIIPVYQLTEGITQKQLRYWLKQALETVNGIPDILPAPIKNKLGLISLPRALTSVHFPDTLKNLEQAKARLAFDELFFWQLAFASYKQTLKTVPAPAIPFNQAMVKKFVENLPFQLTGSQRLALWEILRDMAEGHPMNRLLEGEVGSGKTVVAGIAMYEAAEAGYQSVLLAPTEILAWQHYQTLKNLFSHSPMNIALQTRSHKIGDVREVSGGKTKIIVGTHALLQEHIKFKNIGLLIVDEQHRFGVKQRAKLQNDNQEFVPHLLSMTATPIPRTLALAFYGDLDICQLAELPKGRKKIITKLVRPDGRDIAYRFVKQELKKGRQSYIVVPLVKESEKLEAKSAAAEADTLRKIFSEFTIGVLHGRMSGDEKKSVMRDFKDGKIHILVSTTVVEVGVDVANATVMIIENAERFGLSQLHQLRGRVGRSDMQSYCLLFAEASSDLTRRRLEAVVKSSDGFELAEIDLKLRGAGELLGTQQSGFIPFKIASLSDKQLIESAKKETQELLKTDPPLAGHPELKQEISRLTAEAHLE